MKNFFYFLFVAIALVFVTNASAQVNYKAATDVDYSNSVYHGNKQDWKIEGMSHNETYTIIYIDITITSNGSGAILGQYCGGTGRDPQITIEGPSFKYNYISSKASLRTTYKGAKRGGYTYWDGVWYSSGNKGEHAYLTLYFPRIPVGLKNLRLSVLGGKCGDCAPNPLDGKYECESFGGNIPVSNNEDKIEKTGWKESSLRSYWTENRCEYIEGIYCFASTTNIKWWGPYKHNFAVKKEKGEYKLIYLKGGLKEIWNEGDLKAKFTATGTPGLYKVTEWYMESKLPWGGDFYIAFDNTTMKIYENTADVNTTFLKLFPAYDMSEGTISAQDAAKQGEDNTSGRGGSTNNKEDDNWVGSGSGFFISRTGHIATNYHVVDGMTKFQVEYYQNGKKYTYPAKVISTDPSNDMAIIRIDHKDFTTIPTIPYRFDTKTKDVGTDVFTLGYPLTFIMGEEIKYTKGEISAKSGFQGDIRTYQISVPITNGNSGGPLFDYDGNIVGITSSGLRKDIADNVNYAIKSIYLQTLIDACQENIELPTGIDLTGKSKPEIIKALQGFVVLIKVR